MKKIILVILSLAVFTMFAGCLGTDTKGDR